MFDLGTLVRQADDIAIGIEAAIGHDNSVPRGRQFRVKRVWRLEPRAVNPKFTCIESCLRIDNLPGRIDSLRFPYRASLQTLAGRGICRYLDRLLR